MLTPAEILDLEKIQVDEFEKAKLVVAEREKADGEAAAKEFTDFVKDWSKRTGYTVVPTGQFQGNQIKSSLNIIKIAL